MESERLKVQGSANRLPRAQQVTKTHLLRYVREQFHPLFYLRKWPIGRLAIRILDRPVWLSIPNVNFQVRGKNITHGLAFAATGSQERAPQALALACVSQLKIDAFWDVGANIGYYTWLLKSAAPQLRAVLFEPFEPNCKLIRETLNRNSLPNLEFVAAGASDHSGTGTLFTDGIAGATSSLESSTKTFEERHCGVVAGRESIPLISLDEERPRLGAVDFIKIDVEEHEAAVLRGAIQTIARDQPILFIECNHPGKTCLQPLIAELGYRFVDADRLSLELNEGSRDFFCFPKRFQPRVDSLLDQARWFLGR
jgi:FkbM family methyltransferase